MTLSTNFTSNCPQNIDSIQSPNYTNFVLQNPLQAVAQLHPTFANAFRLNIKIDPHNLDQTIVTPEEVSPNVIKAARTLIARIQGQDMSQINICGENPSEGQVIKARQRARAASDLVIRRKPPKHNDPPEKPILAFNQVLADMETKLLQYY
ncbi:MAG: hypothetical protein EZS28_008256 [Streblomastix strix]|uniref:Uncharacterized protein n=1 Tax=Streblomastix strix TaxID=222440 RepID=A0A5J4WMJ9_9EUKA|nr:MAG: hypothetical protein EZS28_008256 [Streblomastix strix]